jgi:hypothetical protein
MINTILFASTLLFQAAPAGAPVIDNERVTVWTQPQPGTRANDSLLVTVLPATATVQFTPAGATSPAAAGSLVVDATNPAAFRVGGNAPAQERRLQIDLKNKAVEPLRNTTGLPLAFPRPAIKQLLDNARVTVWDYTWTLNQPTPMHFHDKDVVVMFLEEGDLQSTTLDGQKTLNKYTPGTIRFNARNRSHNEELVRGKQRAIIVELK